MNTGDSPEKRIYYSRSQLPPDTELLEEMDLTLTWETPYSGQERLQEYGAGLQELNQLLERKVESLLLDRGGCCIHMKHETITHSINYRHWSSVMTGEYFFTLYKKRDTN